MKEYKIFTEKLNKMIDNDEIESFKFKYDDKNNILNIYIVPKQVVQHLEVNFMVTPKGIDFIET